MATPSRRIAINLALIAVVASIPVVEKFVPLGWHITDPMTDVFVYAILGLGLNILTGFTGLLNLGVAAFAAIGAYVFAISTKWLHLQQLAPMCLPFQRARSIPFNLGSGVHWE
jgi:branched-chain amino acid transport system permease protein